MTFQEKDKLLRDAAQDEGNRNMRKHGRTRWNKQDYDIACKQYLMSLGSVVI